MGVPTGGMASMVGIRRLNHRGLRLVQRAANGGNYDGRTQFTPTAGALTRSA